MKRLTKKESIERMNDFIEKNNYSGSWAKYYMTRAKQNCFLEIDDYVVEITRPSIESTMYYDDEYEAPSTAKESWMFYNINHNFKDRQLEKHIECEMDLENYGCCSGQHMRHWWLLSGHDGTASIQKLYYYDFEKPSNFIRELTRDEMEQLKTSAS